MSQATAPVDIVGITPPHDLDAERELIGAVLLHPASLDFPDVRRLKPRHFFDQGHNRFFGCLLGMRSEGIPFGSRAILVDRLKQAGAWELIGGLRGLGEIVAASATGDHAATLAVIVWRCFKQRQQLELAGELARCVSHGFAPEEIDDTLRIFQEVTAEPPSDEVELLTAAELSDGDFQTEYHITNILAKQQPTIVAAGQKNLKTSIIACDMGLSLATGKRFLGKFDVEQPTPVLVLSGESGRGAIQDCCQRVAQSKGLILSAVQGFTFSDWIPRLDDPKDLDKLKRVIERAGAEVVVCDPAYQMIPGDDASNMFAMGRILRNLTEAAHASGATPILIHHTKGSTGRESTALPELNDVAWAGFKEYARQWILLARRTLYQPGTGHHELWMTVGGSAGHGGGWAVDVDEGIFGSRYWSVSLRSIDEATQAAAEQAELRKAEKKDRTATATLKARASKVYGALEYHGPMTKTGLAKETGMSGRSVNEAVVWLLEDGQVEACEVDTGRGMAGGFRVIGQVTRQPLTTPDNQGLSGQDEPLTDNEPYRGSCRLSGVGHANGSEVEF